MTETRIVRFHRYGGPEVLQLDTVDVPPPGSGEIAIRVAAIGLNRAETLTRGGAYGGDPAALPSPIGLEAAGTVEAVGQDVTGFAPGDPVNVLPGMARLPFGTYADRINVPLAAAVAQPPGLTSLEAAALWAAHLTAYAPMVEIARVGPGDAVLIPAASSSVALAAIGIVRHLGGRPIALTRTRAKQDRLRAYTDDVIVTDEEDLVARVRDLTNGTGARVAFDPISGPGIETLLEAVATDGILVQYGSLSREPTPLPWSVLTRNLTINGYALDIGRNQARRDRAVRFIQDGVAAGALRPVIDSTFSLPEAAAAHTALEANHQLGKLLLTTRAD